MAEWMEVMKQFDRMCWYYQRKRECPMGCPMNGVNISQYRKVAFEQPEVTEKTVMDWAAEHPEPVYPTWAEWLAEQGIVNVKVMPVDDYGGIITQIEPSGKMYGHIPADIAEKLGIEPKEG